MFGACAADNRDVKSEGGLTTFSERLQKAFFDSSGCEA
jgi:hypothetical protein